MLLADCERTAGENGFLFSVMSALLEKTFISSASTVQEDTFLHIVNAQLKERFLLVSSALYTGGNISLNYERIAR